MIDPEDREWNRKFGESYLDCRHEDDLDDEQLDRLENEFLRDADNPYGRRSPYGRLFEVHRESDDDSEAGNG